MVQTFGAWTGTLYVAEMPDYWVNRRKKYHLVDILVIALCALISGAYDFKEIEA